MWFAMLPGDLNAHPGPEATLGRLIRLAKRQGLAMERAREYDHRVLYVRRVEVKSEPE